jgi:hypothetical protein
MLDSYNQAMKRNADGSVDVYFGPKAPAAKETNWIYTAAGKAFFPAMRFYDPEQDVEVAGHRAGFGTMMGRFGRYRGRRRGADVRGHMPGKRGARMVRVAKRAQLWRAPD